MWNRQRAEIRYAAMCISTLQWRHNERDGVSNHRRRHCLLNRWFWCRSTKTSKLCITGLCAGNSPVIGEFSAKKGQEHGKCFHLMTSSWVYENSWIYNTGSYRNISKCDQIHVQNSLTPLKFWHVSSQYCCTAACQIPKWFDDFNYRCPGFETSRDRTIWCFADTETGRKATSGEACSYHKQYPLFLIIYSIWYLP